MLVEELATVTQDYAREVLQEALAAAEAAIQELSGALNRLQPGDQSGNTKPMLPAARVRVSAGTAGDNPDPLIKAANEHHYTLRSLAEAVGCSHALLSQARAGQRSIGADVAKKIEELIGFKATKRNWPKLRQ